MRTFLRGGRAACARRLVLALGLGGLCSAAGGAPAWAFSCTGGEVDIGQGADQVIARCGVPAQRSAWIRLRWEPAAPAVTRGTEVEEWVYDLGPEQPVGVVRLAAGVVEWQEYGPLAPAACDPAIFQSGQPLVTVAAACGLPRRTQENHRRATVTLGDGSVVRATIHTVDWFFEGDPATGSRPLHVQFDNGRFSGESGGRFGETGPP